MDVIQSEALSGPAERDRVLRLLREREIELRQRGVTRLKLFGSIARGEAAGASDVDLIAEIDRGSGFSLIELSGLGLDLGEVIGREVHILTTPDKLRAWVQDSIARDAIEVF